MIQQQEDALKADQCYEQCQGDKTSSSYHTMKFKHVIIMFIIYCKYIPFPAPTDVVFDNKPV